jgi:hypothetical protein
VARWRRREVWCGCRRERERDAVKRIWEIDCRGERERRINPR